MDGNDNTSVLVLFGGMSSEHEVSCTSAASVLSNINRDKYDVTTIGITKDGDWMLTDAPAEDICDGSWEEHEGNKHAILSTDRSIKGILAEEDDGSFSRLDVDVVIPVLHGDNGEDGTMQGLLQISGIPYVGSGTTASAVSMDKAVTKAVLEMSGVVDQAKCYVMYEYAYKKDPEWEMKRLEDRFHGELPLFVKPANAGSSVGITKVKTEEELPKALENAFAEDDKVVIEETIEGRELEVAVLGNDEPRASCIGEIFAANEFYDYDAKYENAASKTDIVTDLGEDKATEIRVKAVKIYRTLGCKGLSRVDFFMEKNGRVVFNEINTLPGFTDISMYPKLWAASGVGYGELIEKLIQLALDRCDD